MRRLAHILAFSIVSLCALEAQAGSTIFSATFDTAADDTKTKLDASGMWTFYSSRPDFALITVDDVDSDSDNELILGKKSKPNDPNEPLDPNEKKNLNEAVLTLDLSGFTNVEIHFDEFTSDDHPDTMKDSFKGHKKGDGLAIGSGPVNDSNTEWFTVWTVVDSHDSPSEGHDHGIGWTSQWFNIESLISGNSLDRSNIHFKFQQFDNKHFPHDGRAFDNILVKGDPIGGGVIPEPSTFSLLALGCIGLAGYRARRRRKDTSEPPRA